MDTPDIIWFDKSIIHKPAPEVTPDTMGSHLGMEYCGIGDNFLQMKMPVDERTRQPYGLLHGGASCALAETVGSVASFLVIDSSKYLSVGLEINANHIRSVTKGWIFATAKPLHLGRTTHVWDIQITDEKQKLVCVSRLTVAIIKRTD